MFMEQCMEYNWKRNKMSKTASVIIFFGFVIAGQCTPSFNLMGKPGEGYYLDVVIGTPPQKFSVLVDTGSTNFAIAASADPNVDTHFVASNSSSFHLLHQTVSVVYTQGYWKGQLGNDVVLFPQLNVPAVYCDISLIETSHNFYMNGSQWQGILGLAYPGIAQPSSSMVSWLEALHHSNNSNMAFSLELCGSSLEPDVHVGSFHVPDETEEVEPTFTSPIVREWFYEVSLVGIDVGNLSVSLPCQEFNNDKTIIDSGTTSLRLPSKVFKKVTQLINITLANEDVPFSNWNLAKMSCGENYIEKNIFPNLKLALAHSKNSYLILDLPPESYIRRVYDPAETMGLKNCYKFAIEPSDTGTVLGVVMMEGLTVIFNQTNKTVGFMESTCGPPVRLSGPFETNIDLRKCSNVPGAADTSALTITAYVIGGLLIACGLLLFYSGSQGIWDGCFRKRVQRSISHESLVTD